MRVEGMMCRVHVSALHSGVYLRINEPAGTVTPARRELERGGESHQIGCGRIREISCTMARCRAINRRSDGGEVLKTPEQRAFICFGWGLRVDTAILMAPGICGEVVVKVKCAGQAIQTVEAARSNRRAGRQGRAGSRC
jgi:hypothetical protein